MILEFKFKNVAVFLPNQPLCYFSNPFILGPTILIMTLSITINRDIQYNDTQSNVVYSYAECHLCSLSIMLSVANKPIMLSVIMLDVVVLSAVMLSVMEPYFKLF